MSNRLINRIAFLVFFSTFLNCSESKISKPESDRLYEEGLRYFYTDRLDQAGERFQKVLELAPDSTVAIVRLSEISLKQGHKNRAQNILWELCSPSANRDLSQADPIRLTLLQLPPDLRGRPEARILQARLMAFEGRALEAHAIATQVLREHPQSLDAQLLLAELALKAASTMDLGEARDLSRQILRQVPTHKDAGLMLIEAQLRLGEFNEAVEVASSLLEVHSDDGYVGLLAGTAAFWGDHKDVIPLLRQAVDQNLDHYTERLKSLWLLKLAWERQGGYPANLPERYRFNPFVQLSANPAVVFVDIGSQTGVDKRDRGRGSAWLDFDGDGDQDLFSVGIQSTHALYRNEGQGQFEDVTLLWGLDDSRGGWGGTAADFDNDGDADLFVTRDAWEGAAANSLYRNEDDRFVDVAQRAGVDEAQASFTAAWGDVDRDGYLDLYVANGVIGDGGRNNLWYNQRDGTFADIGQASGTADSSKTIGTAFGDYDGDGYLDLYVVNIGTPNRLYHNGADGTFVDRADQAGVIFPLEGGYVTFFFDFNNDGQLDLFASTMSAFEDVLNSWVEGRAIEPNRPFLYLNNGDGTFADIAVPAGLGRSFGSMGIGLGDVDNNGFPDIYLANGGPEMYRLEPNALFLNQGDGRFVEVTSAAGVGNLGKGHGATFADFDADGDLDLYAGLGGHYDADVWPNSLYRNDGPVGNYLGLQLVGTASNRDAIGARAVAYCDARQVHGQVASGYGFGSSNALALHLGLGQADQVERLEVRWPSGQSQIWEGVPANRLLRIVEGEANYSTVGDY